MIYSIKPDTLQALKDWKAGKPVRALELGHTHRMGEHPGGAVFVDMGKRIDRDQVRAYAFCFAILDWYKSEDEVHLPSDHAAFLASCDALSQEFKGLTPEEKAGAESLAWKVLVVGWKKAIAGHAESDYIEVGGA